MRTLSLWVVLYIGTYSMDIKNIYRRSVFNILELKNKIKNQKMNNQLVQLGSIKRGVCSSHNFHCFLFLSIYARLLRH